MNRDKLTAGKRYQSDAGIITIVAISYHRNGVSGTGFNVVLFTQKDGRSNQPMVAIVFPQATECAVLDAHKTAEGDIAFGQGNSFRGDCYEDALRGAIAEWERESDRAMGVTA